MKVTIQEKPTNENPDNVMQPKKVSKRLYSVLTCKIVKSELKCNKIYFCCINGDKNSVLNMETITKYLLKTVIQNSA